MRIPSLLPSLSRREKAFLLVMVILAFSVLSLAVFAPWPRIKGSHAFTFPDCEKCHSAQYSELASSDPEHKHAGWTCDKCHGKSHPKIEAVNCTDCHGDKLTGDIHYTMYEQGGESPTDASAACVACHSLTEVHIIYRPKPYLTYYVYDYEVEG